MGKSELIQLLREKIEDLESEKKPNRKGLAKETRKLKSVIRLLTKYKTDEHLHLLLYREHLTN
jgi:hypothetical protein